MVEPAVPITIDLATAAAQYGLSLAALRKRIQRGQLASVKVDGKLRVVVDNDGDKDSSQRPATATKDKGQAVSQRAPAPQLVTLLQEEVVFLRGQLVTRNEEVQRLVAALEAERVERQQLTEAAERAQVEMRQLLAQAQQLHRVTLLPAPVEEKTEDRDTDNIVPVAQPLSANRPWWQFWKRQEQTA